MTDLMRLESVSKFFNKHQPAILHEVDLVIKDADFIAIVGPSGSGKSTLLSILGLLENTSSGKHLVRDVDVSTLSNQQLRELRNKQIAWVFQNFNLIASMTCLENVALPLRFDNKVKSSEYHARALQALKSVGLEDKEDHFPNQLSGGQQQRVAIARALVNEPALIVADEPTGNLDSSTSNLILDIFSDLHAKGVTILLVTHDPEVAKRCTSQIKIADDAFTVIANNLIFSIIAELRKWQKQRTKLLVAMLSLLSLCLISITALELNVLIKSKPPSWADQRGQYVTIGRLSALNILKGVPSTIAQAVEQNSSVKQVGTVMQFHRDFTHPRFVLPKISTIFYNDGLIDTFKSRHLTKEKNAVWLTHAAWVTLFNKTPLDEIGSLSHSRLPNGLRITGVLPKEYDELGTQSVDVYIHQGVFRHFTPFKGDLMIDRFLNAAPFQFIFARVDNSFNASEIANTLNSGDFSVKGMSMSDSGGQVVVLNGFNRTPAQIDELRSKWRLLMFLIVSFTAIAFINLFSVLSNHVVIYKNDFKVMQVLGAPVTVVLRGQLITVSAISFVVCLLILVFSAFVPDVINMTLLASLEHFHIQAFSLVNQAVVAATLICVLFLLAVFTSKTNANALFQRKMGSSQGKAQKFIFKGLQFIQYSSSITTLLIVGLIAYRLFDTSTAYDQIPKTATINVEARSLGGSLGNLSLQASQRGFAISNVKFDNQNSQSIDDNRLPEGLGVQVFYVTENYFNYTHANVSFKEWETGIIINQALYKLLKPHGPVVSSNLNIGSLLGERTITAVVSDLPHNGRSQAPLPAIYLPLSRVPLGHIPTFQILTPSSQATELAAWLDNWLTDNSTEHSIANIKSLDDTISEHDSSAISIFIFGLVIALCMAVIMFLTLFYEVKNRLDIEQQDFATMFALGASRRFVFVKIITEQWLVIFLSFVFVVAVTTNSIESFAVLQDVGVTLLALLLCLLLVVFLTCLSTLLPILNFSKVSIFSKLRS